MRQIYRWGIMGPGNIARKFARGLQVLPEAVIQAVASNSAERADAFAREFGVKSSYPNYQSLAEDREVDIVYVANLHPGHRAAAELALAHGKHVLCEKPMTINAPDTRAVAAAARKHKRFCMEAMWTRFFPIMKDLRRRLQEGQIGEIRLIQADLGFQANVNPASRLFALEHAGGAMLDIGVYPMAFFHMLLGVPEGIQSDAVLGSTGVDEHVCWTCRFQNHAMAQGACSIQVSTRQEAHIYGTRGRISLPSAWWHPTSMTIQRHGAEPEPVEYPLEGTGMNYEAAEVMDCIRAGALESSIMPLADSIAIAESMDQMRAQWGLRYPMES